MQKTAQKRNILNKLREMTNVSGIAAEKFFNPEFKRVMESLRKNDDAIRSIASGSTIGDTDESILKGDPTSLKDLLKSAKSSISRREYMSAAADLGRFHKKLFDIKELVGQFDSDVSQVHHEFLFKELSPEQKEHLQGLKTRFAFTASEYFIKEASIMDFFMNIGTKRGRALAAWEKRYPGVVGKIKKETSDIYQKSVKLLGSIISNLKDMASARSIRNVDAYVKASGKLTNDFNKYDAGFKGYYNNAVKPFLDKIDLIEKKIEESPTKEVEKSKEVGQQEIPVDKKDVPSLEMPSMPGTQEAPSLNMPATLHRPDAPGLPEAIPLIQKKQPELPFSKTEPAPPSTDPSPPPSGMESNPFIPKAPKLPSNLGPAVPVSDTSILPPKMTHKKFFAALESLSNESPILLSTFIRKYANSIQEIDPETSIQLFQIAKNIV